MVLLESLETLTSSQRQDLAELKGDLMEGAKLQKELDNINTDLENLANEAALLAARTNKKIVF